MRLWKSKRREERLDATSDQYDSAEQEYLAALAAGADDATLQQLARRVAETAAAFEVADAAAGRPPQHIGRYYDVPEVLANLWDDLADAHSRRNQS